MCGLIVGCPCWGVVSRVWSFVGRNPWSIDWKRAVYELPNNVVRSAENKSFAQLNAIALVDSESAYWLNVPEAS